MMAVVHGDDVTALDVEESVGEYARLRSEAFELKLRGRLGEEAGCDKADPRHAELHVVSMCRQCKAAALTPGVTEHPTE